MTLNALTTELNKKSNTTHDHNTLYYTQTQIDSKLSSYSTTSHNHDTSYYKKSEIKTVATTGSYNDLTNKPTIPTVPTSLKNPQPLVFTGGSTVSYDGSTKQTVNIPNNYVAKTGDTMTGNLSIQNDNVAGNGVDNNYKDTFKAGVINIGDRLQLCTDNEGGNIRIKSPSNTNTYEIDAYNGDLRLYHNNGSIANSLTIHNSPTTTYGFTHRRGALFVNQGLYNGSLSIDYGSLIINGTEISDMVKPGRDATSDNISYSNMLLIRSMLPDSISAIEVFTWCKGMQNYKDTDEELINFGPSHLDTGTGHYYLGRNKAWTNIYAAKAVTVNSDRRLKRDIKDFDDDFVREFIMGIKPKKFGYKNGDRTHYGFIAQDIEELMRSLNMTNLDFSGLCITKPIRNPDEEVNNDELDEVYGLRYEEFISPLLRMVQIQQSEIDDLKKEVSELKKIISSL